MNIKGLTTEDDLAGTVGTSSQGHLPDMDEESFRAFAKKYGAEVEDVTDEAKGDELWAAFEVDGIVFDIYNRWGSYQLGSRTEERDKVQDALSSCGIEVVLLCCG